MPTKLKIHGGASSDYGRSALGSGEQLQSLVQKVGNDINNHFDAEHGLKTNIPATIEAANPNEIVAVKSSLTVPVKVVDAEAMKGGKKVSRKPYEKCTRDELVKKAKTKKIKGVSGLTKSEIIKRLRK
jgi:hypothetical protein